MASTVAVQQSRVIAVGVDDAFAGTLPIPLTTIFSRWYGPIPPVAEVRDQEGEWGTPGQTRVVAFKGPGEMVTWHWTIHAASAISAPLLPLVGALWKGYARQSLAVLAAELVR